MGIINLIRFLINMNKLLSLLVTLTFILSVYADCDGNIQTTNKKTATLLVNKKTAASKLGKVKDFIEYDMPAFGDAVSIEYDDGKNRVVFSNYKTEVCVHTDGKKDAPKTTVEKMGE